MIRIPSSERLRDSVSRNWINILLVTWALSIVVMIWNILLPWPFPVTPCRPIIC